jgi:hypothetical protein
MAARRMSIEGRIEIGGQEHFYLEGQAALALPQEGGDMVVHSSTQHPTEIQHKVADALGVPMHAVRVEVRRMGGGFGGKESQGNALAVACAVAARATGRPARCAMTATTIWSSPASGTISASPIAPGSTATGGSGGRFRAICPLRLGAGPVAAGGRPGDAACRQRLLTCPPCGSPRTG